MPGSVPDMDTTHRLPLVFSIVTMLVLAACGGGPGVAAPTSGGGSESSSVPVGGSTVPDGGAVASTTPAGPGSAVPGGPPSIAEPCTLLTEAEIRQATGFEIKWIFPSEDTPGDLPVGCNWSLGTAELGADIVIGVRSPGGAALFDPSRGDPVDGIGDRAYQSEPAVVDAVKGDTFVSVTYIGSEGDDPEITRELARMIMEKV